MRDIEHQIAVAVMQWWAYWSRAHEIDERLLFAIPNGGHRHISVAKKMKAEGVRAGIPDYFLAVARNGFHGMFLELKAGGKGIKEGRTSQSQHEMGWRLRDEGYVGATAYGTDEAISMITRYLTGERA